MKVRRITLHNFTEAHDSFDLELPTEGVVLVVGANGSGKSAIIEAVAEGLFGKTLRGTSPWRTETAGFVRLECGDGELVVERSATAGGRKRLQFTDSATYDTTTKAQEALQKIVGTFAEWRKAFTFSSSDAAHFTGATDAERKRLLESLLGLARFDSGSKQCREDLREAKKQCDALLSRQKILMAQLDAGSVAIKRAQESLDNLPEKPQAVDLRSALQEAQTQHEAAVSTYGSAATTIAEHSAALATARNEVARVQAGQCVTCGRDFDGSDLGAALDRVRELESVSVPNLSELKTAVDSTQSCLLAVQKQQAAYESQLSAFEAMQQEKARLQRIVEEETVSHSERITALRDVQVDRSNTEELVLLLSNVSEVLGVRGARTLVLSRALRGLQEIANAWLSKLPVKGGQILQLRLQASDSKIVLEVDGAGGGKGYRACSSGQRKRIDAAVMMALSEISCAATSKTGGTLFMDEILDGLDTAGMVSLCEAINDLATDRCVVLISHRDVADCLDVCKVVTLS